MKSERVDWFHGHIIALDDQILSHADAMTRLPDEVGKCCVVILAGVTLSAEAKGVNNGRVAYQNLV